jgi:hypothetical protein
VVQYTGGGSTPQYAQHAQNFGVCAVDLQWNLTTELGINNLNHQPQGRIILTNNISDGSLYFYNDEGIPVIRWYYNGTFTHLQNSTWDAWHKLTLIRNGSQSKVIIDETPYSVTSSAASTDQVYLGTYWPTREFFDNVRVRKWTTPEPSFTVGSEISLLKASESHTAILCHGENSSVTITATGGTTPYTGIGTFSQPAGTVVYTVNDARDCTSDVSVTITQPAAIPVNGIIQYYNLALTLLENVTIKLQQEGEDKYTTLTNSIGEYSFSNVCPGTYDVVVTTVNPVGGINATDAAQVNYWGTEPWEIEKVRFYAGDATLDNVVAAADASNILAYFVSAGTTTISPTWKFWLAGETISANPSSPPSGLQLPSVTYAAGLITQDIYGLCTGDFNQSFIPGGTKDACESLVLKYGKTIYMETGDELELPIYTGMDMDIGAVSLILNFPSDKVEISDVFLTSDPAAPLLFNISGDELRVGWNSLVPVYLSEGESLITLKLKVIAESGDEGISISLAADPLNELADGNFFVINDAVLIADVIHTSALGVIENNLANNLELANHPNPFKGTTIFEYSLPMDGWVILEIYDLVGNKIKVAVDEIQTAGDYTLKMDASILQPGVYMASLRLSNEDSKLIRAIKIISR